MDWRKWLNRLVFCYGCGRFGMPRKGRPPFRWKVLYQPHPDAPPGLHACSDRCADKIRDAMKKGPLIEPLEMGQPPMMDAEIRHQMMQDITGAMEDEFVAERPFVFRCKSCEKRLDPQSAGGIFRIFDCPACGQGYEAKMRDGEIVFDPTTSKESVDDDTVPRATPDDS